MTSSGRNQSNAPTQGLAPTQHARNPGRPITPPDRTPEEKYLWNDRQFLSIRGRDAHSEEMRDATHFLGQCIDATGDPESNLQTRARAQLNARSHMFDLHQQRVAERPKGLRGLIPDSNLREQSKAICRGYKNNYRTLLTSSDKARYLAQNGVLPVYDPDNRPPAYASAAYSSQPQQPVQYTHVSDYGSAPQGYPAPYSQQQSGQYAPAYPYPPTASTSGYPGTQSNAYGGGQATAYPHAAPPQLPYGNSYPAPGHAPVGPPTTHGPPTGRPRRRSFF